LTFISSCPGVYAQNLSDLSYAYASNTAASNVTTTQSVNNDPLVYEFCDEDGIIEVNISQIESDVLEQFGVNNNYDSSIFISTSTGRVIKINAPFEGGVNEEICYLDLPGFALSDIAIDENGEFYINGFSQVLTLNTSNCVELPVFVFDFGTDLNSLSFDTNGNLYYGFGSDTAVYRFNADELTDPYVWHDFQTGSAGGDFVVLNDKMYISWKQANNSYRLFEVSYDADFNYISHINIGVLPNNTYGLASELGHLYGVTPTELYKINLEDFSFTTVLQNNGSYGDWYGATGLNEAVDFQLATYTNYNDAVNNTNALPDVWSNTEAGLQSLFVKVDDITNQTSDIIEVILNIGIIPQLNQPMDLIECFNDSYVFDLTVIEENLIINHEENPNTVISYYDNLTDTLNQTNAVETDFEVDGSSQTIYVRVDNIDSSCYDYEVFHLIKHSAPGLTEITNEAEGIYLDNCYINFNDQGYFNLNEIHDQVVLYNYNYELHFFTSFEDAENNVNELSPIYDSTIGQVEEIFVKATNEEGCSSIANFFIDGDCVLTTKDITKIHFPKFFTPNQDRFHDFWNVKGISNKIKNQAIMSIFDRYGKLLIQFNPNQSMGWDGTFINADLPTNDYWYKLVLHSGEIFTGHFSLVR